MDRLAVMFLSLACLAAAPPVRQAPAPATQPGTAAAEAEEFATFGVDVATPPGWQRLWEGRANTIARWSNGSAAARASAMMTLELEAANGRTLAQHAEALRKHFRDAQIGIHALVMGGQPAMRVTGKDADGNAAVDVLVTLNGEYIYTLTGVAAVPRLLPTAVMDEIARTMRFREIADPALAAAAREPVALFDRFTFAPLATMRPDTEPPPARTVYLRVADYRTAPPRAALSADIQILHNPRRLPLIDLAAQTTQRIAPGAAVAWDLTSSTTARAVSQPFTFGHPDGRRVHARLGLVRLRDDEVLYLHFGIGAEAPGSRAALESACALMIESVHPLAK
jgi:hypothetical protein